MTTGPETEKTEPNLLSRSSSAGGCVSTLCVVKSLLVRCLWRRYRGNAGERRGEREREQGERGTDPGCGSTFWRCPLRLPVAWKRGAAERVSGRAV